MAKVSAKADVRLKDFWRPNERFADLFNAVVFKGKEVLKPELLQEMDTDMSGIIQFKNYEESVVRIRDIVKKTALGVDFVVLGIENQQHIHYAMPLRTLLYDGLGYLKEYQEITRLRKADKGKITVDEFLSQMRGEDRLHPIITIIVYYGEKPWDGPVSLKDMIVDMPEEIENVFSDYKMNLVQVRESGQYIFHNEDVRTVFEISREIFSGNFENIQQKYGQQDIKAELAAVIGKITDSSEIVYHAEGREAVNMCTALEKLKQEGIEQGINQGIKQGVEQGIQSVIEKLLHKGYTSETIAEMLDITVEEVKEVQK